MDIILRTDVEKLGKLGDIVTVKPGYARNFLIPYGKAMLATDANKKKFEDERDALQAKVDALRTAAETMGDKLDGLSVAIEVRVGESDKLYGSVTAANIGEALAAMDIELDRRKILLEEPIRALGIYEVEVKLFGEVRPKLEVAVVKNGQTVEELKEILEAEARGDRPEVEGPGAEMFGAMDEEDEELESRAKAEASAEAAVEQAAAEEATAEAEAAPEEPAQEPEDA